MQLSSELRHAYETVWAEAPLRTPTEAAQRLSPRYRCLETQQVEAEPVYIQTDEERWDSMAMRSQN